MFAALLQPLALAAAVAAATTDQALDALLAKARAATGIEAFARSGQELVIEGESTLAGVPGRWSLRVAADGRFVSAIASRLSASSGFDGTTAWQVDRGGIPSSQVFEQREHTLLEYGLGFGAWCLPVGPLVPVAVDGETLRIRARDGQLVVEADLDPKTQLPKCARYDAGRGAEVWSFADWRPEGGLQVAHEFTIDDAGQKNVLRVTSARLAPAAGAAAFAVPKARPDDTTFAAGAPSRLVCKLTRTSHLLVKASIDGGPDEWMIFDSGAGSSILSPAVAKQHGLEPFGEYWIGGAGADRAAGHFYEAKQLTVGPATLQRPTFGELDLAGLESALDEKFSGIVGYNLLQRVVARVDMGKGAVDLFDPATYAPTGVTWRPLLLHGNHPHVECSFGHDDAEEAVFRLDTGAPGVTVLFHSPCVKSLGLLEGRATQPFTGLGGIGGQSAARIGKLPWFELGGLTIDDPSVVFIEDERGALADPWTAGTIGGGFLHRFDLIFDYPHARVGFVPHPPTR